MTRKEFKEKRYQISFAAGTNQRYHQDRAGLWTKCDRGVKIGVGILAFAGACLAVVTASRSLAALDYWSAGTAILAAVAALVLNIIPLGDWASEHTALFQRWTDLREDVDALAFDISDKDPSGKLIDRLQELDAKVHRICGSEPACNQQLLERCYSDEKRSRSFDTAPCAS